MESEAKYTYVGTAILVLILGLVFALVWLKRAGAGEQYHYYTIYFERLPLDGLNIGSEVLMRGLKVGQVKDYAISSENINRVRVTIAVDRRTPVSQNTAAGIDRNYVTRIARIDLETPGEPGPPLTEAPAGETYPVIPEGRSELAEIAGTLKGLGEQSAEVLVAFERLLSEKNQDAFSETLANARDLTAGLNARLARFDRTLETFDSSIAQIGRAGIRIETTAGQLGAEFKPTMAQARSTLQDLSRAANSLEIQSTALGQRATHAANTASDQISATALELRRSAAAIAQVVEGLENPRAALMGPNKAQLGPGEKRK
ncbi:MAG: MlaD family protein [Burkholderiales bacterium]